MSGPEVRVTVLGDVDDFTRGMKEVGTEAEKAGDKVKRDLGESFDAMGETAGGAERKFIGLSDSISGTSDVMQGLRTGNVQQLAMGFADLAGAAEALWASVGKTITTWWAKVTATGADTAATTANTGATIGQRIATTATTIATKAHAAAQWLLNTALSANPIMLVVVALAALVAGFVIAYKNVGWFRDIVDAVARFFTDTLWPILQDVGGWLGGVFVAMWDAARVAVGWVIDQGQALYDLVSTYVFPVLETVAGWIGTYFVAQFNLAKDVVGFLIDVFGWVVDKVNTYVMPVLGTLAGWIGGAFVTQFGLARDAVGFVIDKFQDAWTKAVEVKDGITGAFDTVVTFIGGLAGRIATAASGMWDGIKDAFRSALNWVIDKWNGLNFPGISVKGIEVVPGFGTPDIARFATGGLVKGGRGGVLGMVGEGAHDELIVPLDRAGRAGGFGTTINVTVNAPVGASSRDIGRELQRHLNEYARAS